MQARHLITLGFTPWIPPKMWTLPRSITPSRTKHPLQTDVSPWHFSFKPLSVRNNVSTLSFTQVYIWKPQWIFRFLAWLQHVHAPTPEHTAVCSARGGKILQRIPTICRIKLRFRSWVEGSSGLGCRLSPQLSQAHCARTMKHHLHPTVPLHLSLNTACPLCRVLFPSLTLLCLPE